MQVRGLLAELAAAAGEGDALAAFPASARETAVPSMNTRNGSAEPPDQDAAQSHQSRPDVHP
jgi:hypothetical protein